MIGSTVSHFRVVEKVGEGGMGVVFRAQDTNLDRTVALKVLPARMPAEGSARARLLREARTASALNHPNICTVYEIGETRGQTYIAMEYIEGRTLSALIPKEGLPLDQLLRYGKQIAEALAHSHERGVVHRDLKSSNVMITAEGRVKVLDFGLAKRLASAPAEEEATQTQKDPLTQVGAIVGTLAYMSPEALRGEPADMRSDVWSFGVLLYEMAAGRLPFQGKSTFELTSAVLREPVPEPPAGIGAGLRAVIQRCLDRVPGERYQRGGEVRAAMEAVESGSRSMPAVIAPPLTRRRWLWTASAAAAVAGAGAIVWRRRRRTYAPVPSKVQEANEYFQRAMVFLGAQADLPRARQLLEKTLALDPHFAHARAWYGFTHVLLIDSGLSNDETWLYKAEEELWRALQDDPNSARAHAALIMVYLYEGRKDLAAQEARKTIELNPNEREGYIGLAVWHSLNGDIEASQALFKKLLDSDPLFIPARLNVGENLREMGDPDGCIREQEKILDQDPKIVQALILLAQAHMTKGDLAKSRQALERAHALEPRNYQVRLIWALQLALEGKRAEALREMDADALKYGERPTGFASLAVPEFYAVVGDQAQALDWLERVVRSGDERGEWFSRDPLLASVHKEPRFRRILESIRYRREQRAKGTPQLPLQ